MCWARARSFSLWSEVTCVEGSHPPSLETKKQFLKEVECLDQNYKSGMRASAIFCIAFLYSKTQVSKPKPIFKWTEMSFVLKTHVGKKKKSSCGGKKKKLMWKKLTGSFSQSHLLDMVIHSLTLLWIWKYIIQSGNINTGTHSVLDVKISVFFFFPQVIFHNWNFTNHTVFQQDAGLC